ncbi:hypothetical protein [Actinomadura sp. DC4]|uniref:hypothetical protein n=1 Tax=Actinomadura sp. DC4 TaxID=3055069 RepID=UPI0025AF89FC|nr:hypothetical protein [Actinomadura sp. DC4]MDN3354935.1 hypothetical protein [Actinomadura sp. DC4]
MSDPIKSQYDQHPLDPNDHSHDDDKVDLGNTQSPELNVAWTKHPSFNNDPRDIDEGPDSGAANNSPATDAQEFSIDLQSVGTQVESMLTTARGLVSQYEALRSKVLASEGTVFGQKSLEDPDEGFFDFSDGVYTPPADSTPQPTVWAEPAQKFATTMNPAQEKALQNIGNTLERVGEYIALVNHSGQVYAQTDRQSIFPAPPSKGVLG